MIPTIAEIEALHKKYATNERMFDLIFTHCKIVSEIALWCADTVKEQVDRELLEVSVLLHDIGSYSLMTDEGKVHSHFTYKQHPLLGAAIIRGEGLDSRIAEVVETHLQMGVTKEEIIKQGMPLPARSYEPTSMEGQILCYADRFHSKAPKFNAVDTYRDFLQKVYPGQTDKFMAAVEKFGVPNLETLSKKYGHPVV